VAELNLIVAALPPSVVQNENVAAFDERGIGSSGQITCGPPLAQVAAASPLPSRRGAPMSGAKTFAAIGVACAPKSKGVDTWTSAGDLDQIRRALGLKRIGIYGISYGTVLALTYASRFPSSTSEIVLDGTVDPRLSLVTQAAAQAPALDAAFETWVAQCASSSTCSWRPASLPAFNKLAASLARTPLQIPGQPSVTDGDLLSATLLTLSDPGLFTAPLAQALSSAAAGDGSGLRTLSQLLLSDLDGASTVPALWATQCQDATTRLNATQAGSIAARLGSTDALGAEAVTNNLAGCVSWPAALRPLDRLRFDARVPTLVIESLHDPNTPVMEARLVASRLGATVISSSAEGHTWILNNGYSGVFSTGSPDACVDGPLSAFIASPNRNRPGRATVVARC
jgi:pimeloyl-ACP methyl ester carboxylesterase